jgi:5-methylcytosine-specific restriction endonuclease McrA
VQVAHALKVLPAISRSFAGGELSYSKVRALTRAANQQNEDEKGGPLNIRRKTRIIPKAIQRALHARDNGCCRFPGCGNRRYLHSHHIEHWSSEGETSLPNLMLLCTKHHAGA